MNVETEFTSAKEESVLVKLDEKQVTANQKCKAHKSYGLAAISPRTKLKHVEICAKPAAPKIPKCQKRGRKKPEPMPVHSTPIPIQPKIFPNSQPFQLFGATCSSGSGISQLNQIEPTTQRRSINKSTTEGLKILNVMSLQSHCVSQVSCLDHLKPPNSCDASLVLNTSGNSVLFQVCRSNFSPHSLNEIGSSNAVASQLSGVLLNTNELVSCQAEPCETSPLQLSLLSNSDKEQIQIQPAPLFQSSLHPVGVGHLNENTNKVQIQMILKQQDQSGTCIAVQNKSSLSPIVPCHIETPVHHNFLSVSNSSLNAPLPRKLKSISPKIVIQDFASSVPVVGNSETLTVNSQHAQRVDDRKILNAPMIISSKRKVSKNKSKDQALWCFDVKPGSSTCLKTGIQSQKGKACRHLISFPVTAKNSMFVQPLLVEHSKIAPMQISELSLKNVKSKRRGRQKRITLKRCMPVPIRPKVTPKCDYSTEIQRPVNECQTSSVLQPIKIEIASCDMKSSSQDSCTRKLEYSRANGSHILRSQSSDVQSPVQSPVEKCITSNSLNSISLESSLLSEIQKKLKFCKTVEISPANQNLLNHENVEYKTSLHMCTAVNISSDTVSPSLSLLPMHIYKTPSVSAQDPTTLSPHYLPVACKDEDADGRDNQNSARQFSLQRKTTCQKPEKHAFILGSGDRFENSEKNSNCSSVLVQNVKRKNLVLTSNEATGNCPTISNSDLNETFGSKRRSNVFQQQQKLSRFVPILPRPTYNHMCIFSQAVGHRGHCLWDRLFKKKLARKMNRSLSAPRQNINKQRRKQKRKLERNTDEN